MIICRPLFHICRIHVMTAFKLRGHEMVIYPVLGKLTHVQGVPKKMQHSDFSLRSVLEVRFNFFTYVSESEFRARSIWAHYRPPIQNLKCPKTLKMHARTLIFPHPSEVKPELCRLCTSSPIPICVGRHYYSWSTLNWVLYLHCTVICDHQSWKWTENWIISSSKHAK